MLRKINTVLKCPNIRFFAGKTELPGKFKTPVMLKRSIKFVFFAIFTLKVYPPPGKNLQLPNWTPEFFMKKIGGDCEEFGEKFKSLKEIFELNNVFSYTSICK